MHKGSRAVAIAAIVVSAVGLGACARTARLYDGDAGFPAARTGAAEPAPIRVGGLPGFDTGEVIGVWNRDAGRTIAVVDTAEPQVKFVGDLPASGPAAWVQPLPDRFGPYTSCVIHFDPSRLATDLGITGLQHEFGHCLGFRDIEFFPQKTRADNEQCEAENRPDYNGTALRMSYCFYWTPQLWGGPGDRASLFDAGYGILDH
ncbi:MAG: hypothetical protein ABW219_15935 [Ilumatobacteraceae bacterium]